MRSTKKGSVRQRAVPETVVDVNTVLADLDRKKKLSKAPEVIERRAWYNNLRNENHQLIKEELDLHDPYPDGQLPPWEEAHEGLSYFQQLHDQVLSFVPEFSIPPPAGLKNSTKQSSKLEEPVTQPVMVVKLVSPKTKHEFKSMALDLAEESLARVNVDEQQDFSTRLDLPIYEYDRTVHFEKGFDACTKWLRPLNKRAKQTHFEVKTKLKISENMANKRGATAPIGRSFARKAPSRVAPPIKVNPFHQLSSSGSMVSEAGGMTQSTVRAKLMRLVCTSYVHSSLTLFLYMSYPSPLHLPQSITPSLHPYPSNAFALFLICIHYSLILLFSCSIVPLYSVSLHQLQTLAPTKLTETKP